MSQHNGLIERLNRTLEEWTQALLTDSGFPQTLWNMAIETAEFLYNCTPHSAINNKTMYSMWFGQTADLQHLILFGSRVYILTMDRRQGAKFRPVASRRYICGYTPTGYVLYNPKTNLTE